MVGSAPLATFFTSPLSTEPGPTSDERSARRRRADARRSPATGRGPAPRPGGTAPRWRTARRAWAARRRWRRPAPSACRSDSARRRGARRSSAGRISAQWNGALTASATVFFAPSSLARSDARLTAPACAGDHHLPRGVDVGRADHLVAAALLARARDHVELRAQDGRHAAPCTGTASCIAAAAPRSRTIDRSVGDKPSVPAATSWPYSPGCGRPRNPVRPPRRQDPQGRDAGGEDRGLRRARSGPGPPRGLRTPAGSACAAEPSQAPKACVGLLERGGAPRETRGRASCPCQRAARPVPGTETRSKRAFGAATRRRSIPAAPGAAGSSRSAGRCDGAPWARGTAGTRPWWPSAARRGYGAWPCGSWNGVVSDSA